MSEKRFRLAYEKGNESIFEDLAHPYPRRMTNKEVERKLNEQQATIEEYKDFCLNLCKFLIQKDFVDEYREKYGKEYKIITKWKGCGSE